MSQLDNTKKHFMQDQTLKEKPSPDELSDFLQTTPFKCEKCHASLTAEALINSVSSYGVIFLAGELDGYVGWSCPTCMGRRTNLINLERDGFYRFFDSVQGSFTKPSRALVYRSFPHISAFSDEKEQFRRWSERMDKPGSVVELPKSLNDFESASKYRSFISGHRAMGDAISVCWYSKDNIDLLIEMENETGSKKFPRFCCYNPSFQRLDTFCWENSLKFLFVEDNYGFIFDNRHFEERRLVQCHDFLSLLQTLYFDKSFHINSDTNRLRKYQYEYFNEKVWPKFRTDGMQELLSKISIDFICDYIDSTGKVDSSIDSIIDVIEVYLGKIYDSALSPKKRNDFIVKANSNHQKRVEEAEKSFPKVRIISRSDVISDIKEKISRWAPNPSVNRFLITGEAGTGKQLFADAIHAASKSKALCIKVNCASISQHLFESEIFGHVKGSFTGADRDKKGILEAAEGGTVFFDELKHLSLNLQAKLLCVLQDRKFMRVGGLHEIPLKCKLVFATNEPLPKLIEEKKFHPDLYDRIKTFELHIPPLRDRKEDIPILIEYFINEETKNNPELKDITITESCLKYLKSLYWVGNIRDIESLINYVMANRDKGDKSEITENELPSFIMNDNKTRKFKRKNGLVGNMKYTEKDISESLKEAGDNLTHAAKILGANRSTVSRRLRKMKSIKPSEHNSNPD